MRIISRGRLGETGGKKPLPFFGPDKARNTGSGSVARTRAHSAALLANPVERVVNHGKWKVRILYRAAE
jgi:hypothetical protein